MMGDNTCPLWNKTHRPHNHNGELRMDRNRCPFFFFPLPTVQIRPIKWTRHQCSSFLFRRDIL